MAFTDEEYNQIAIINIKNYLNKSYTDIEITTNYPLAIKKLVAFYQSTSNLPSGTKSMTEGNQSITVNGEIGDIPSDVKSLLPKPLIKMY
jgi:hypothetical protein